MRGLELWGGPECTVSRVGDAFSDQLHLTGHHDRLEDLDLLAALNLKAVRYPLLWERTAPDPDGSCDWRWADERLARLRTLGLRVIAGLVHHGSGPRHTNLLDPVFAPGLAAYAAQVAQRYPWIEAWTPVNEPVTTARFSALYGVWYPHRRDEKSFWLALLNQVDATRLAMRAVRAVNPAAQLIQTDDLGRTYGTAPLRVQAGFDNARRWAGWDLLCGRVTRQHPMFTRIARFGLADRLQAIADDPCPPDIIGINHYVTSDRFLDHRVRRYPEHVRGGNGRMRYADIEAVRVLEPRPAGLEGALREAAARYGIPIAITETHNGCTREEQARWTAEAWSVAQRLRDDGVDIRAVTTWALFGAQGWNTLLTEKGLYEPGAFDVRGGKPRPTAVARLLSGLSEQQGVHHPAMSGNGWWQRPIRILHDPIPRPAPMREHLAAPAFHGGNAPLLITGATGTLGQALARACRHRDIAHVLTSRAELAIDDPASIAAALERHRPWAVINAAGWVRVDDAEAQVDACMRANALGTRLLAEACAARGIGCTGFSSDLVFDGDTSAPYRETDAPRPLGAYGRSKLEAEQALTGAGGLMIRTAAFFSPFDERNFAIALVEALSAGRRFAAAADQIVSPTYVPHLADAVLDLTIDDERGIWHVAGNEPLSWADFARRIAAECGLDAGLIDAVPGATLPCTAPRTAFAALTSMRGNLLPELDVAIRQFAGVLAGCKPQPCATPTARDAAAPVMAAAL